MILTALAQLAEDEGLVKNPDYQPMPVRWLITVGPNGQFRGEFRDMQSPPADKKGKPTVMRFDIPKRSSRTTQNLAEFIVDKPEYVLGWLSPDDLKCADPAKVEKLRKRAADRHGIYKAETAIAATAAGDDAVTLLAQALGGPPPPLPDDLGSGDLIGFVDAEGNPIWSRPKVVAYWATRRRQPECGTGQPGSSATAAGDGGLPCLVTGTVAPPVELHPRPKGIPPVAKTKGGVPLTSVNADAFDSYGLGRVGGAAVSQEAADAYEKALNRLLADGYPDPLTGAPMPRRNVRLTDDTAVVFWSKGNSAAVDLFADSLGQGEPAAVEALYRATWKGQPVNLDDPAAFYALTLSGAQGRATVRGWQEERLGEVLRHVRQYFDDIEIAGRDQGWPRPLLGMVASLGVRNKLDNAPSGLLADLFAAILAGGSFPYELLAAAVRRTRVEKDDRYQRFDEWQRMGLIRGYLVRARRAGKLPPTFPEVRPMVDEECPAPAYRLGRLFAALEGAQQDALRNLTAGIRDRYYGAASATPAVVFPQLLRKLPHHLKNASRPVYYEKLVQQILDGMEAKAFPPTLSLEAQGLFALGYFHQRQALFAKSPEHGSPAPDPDPDAQEV